MSLAGKRLGLRPSPELRDIEDATAGVSSDGDTQNDMEAELAAVDSDSPWARSARPVTDSDDEGEELISARQDDDRPRTSKARRSSTSIDSILADVDLDHDMMGISNRPVRSTFQPSSSDEAREARIAKAKEAAENKSRIHKRNVILAWIVFLIAVLVWSVMGPSFIYLNRKGIPSVLAACWRNQCVLFFVIPPGLYQLLRTPREKRRRWYTSFLILRQMDAATAATEARELRGETGPDVSIESHNSEVNRMNDFRGDDQDLTLSSPSSISGASSTSATLDTAEGATRPTCWSRFKRRMSHLYNVTLECPLTYTVLSGIFWTLSLSLWVVSLRYTSTTLASLFSSLSPVVLVGWLKLKKKPVSNMEMVGVAISLLGVVFCVLSPFMTGTDSDEDTSLRAATGPAAELFGAFLNILASFALAGSTVVGAKSRSEVPLFVHTSISTSIIAMLQMILAVLFEGASLHGSPSVMPDGVTPVPARMRAIFGWAHADVAKVIIFLAFLGGCIGLVGFNIAIVYIPPLAYTVIQLLDPPLTGVVSYIMGLEPLPKWPVYLGAAILVGGIVVLVVGEDRRSKAEKLAEQQAKAEEQGRPAVVKKEPSLLVSPTSGNEMIEMGPVHQLTPSSPSMSSEVDIATPSSASARR